MTIEHPGQHFPNRAYNITSQNTEEIISDSFDHLRTELIEKGIVSIPQGSSIIVAEQVAFDNNTNEHKVKFLLIRIDVNLNVNELTYKLYSNHAISEGVKIRTVFSYTDEKFKDVKVVRLEIPKPEKPIQ